jgi:Ca2+-binding EF-hand superfamily protein
MAEGMHARKMSARFDTFDRDGDGYISQREVEQMARAICEAFEASPDWGKGRAMLRGAGAFWRGLADEIDDEFADGGRLTRQQFIDAAKRALLDHPEGFNRIVRPWTEASVAIVDADGDGDGEITLEEWGRLLLAVGADDAAVQRRLQATDRDVDGRLSVRDLLSAAQAYYTTDDDMPDFVEV